MKKIVIDEIAQRISKNFTLTQIATVDNYGINLALIDGQYPFHRHNGDEFFLILKGEIFIDIKDNPPVILKEGEGFLIKEGTIHRSRSNKKSLALVFEARDLSYLIEEE
ncbi:MAG: cupin domain-containing protein [Candidatus Aminicenantia bacterium]